MNEIEKNPLEILRCVNHPNRQTVIRCSVCGDPICLDCAVSTPDGYRCTQCIEKQKRTILANIRRDSANAAGIATATGFLGSIIQSKLSLSSVLLSIILGIGLGTLCVNLIRFTNGKRTSAQVQRVIYCAAGFGAAIPWLQQALTIFRSFFFADYSKLLLNAGSMQWSVLYIVSLCAAIWANLQGISIFHNR